ncbi:MAG: MOSC domain-containing protein [Acidobacteria bacterium]|nr:MOSC domain-containing protein [Acidobacteriota bacterium]
MMEGGVPKGFVVSIHIRPKANALTVAIEQVRAVPGKGLKGDHYFKSAESSAGRVRTGPDREITLIEIEALEALKRDYGIELGPGEARRNVLTRGIGLSHLVGLTFQVGEVHLHGIRLCEPCGHLEELTGKEVRPGLVHRGGLRAQILTEGEIRVGDSIGD